MESISRGSSHGDTIISRSSSHGDSHLNEFVSRSSAQAFLAQRIKEFVSWRSVQALELTISRSSSHGDIVISRNSSQGSRHKLLSSAYQGVCLIEIGTSS